MPRRLVFLQRPPQHRSEFGSPWKLRPARDSAALPAIWQVSFNFFLSKMKLPKFPNFFGN